MAKRRQNPDSKVLAAILLVGGAAVYFLTRSSASAGEQGGGGGFGGDGSGDGSGSLADWSGSDDDFRRANEAYGRNQALPEGWGNTPLDPDRFRLNRQKAPPRLIFPTVAEQMARPYEFPGKPAPISVPNIDKITARDRQRALNWYRDLMVAYSTERNRVSALQSAQSVSRGLKPSPVLPKVEPFARLAEDGAFGPLSTAAADQFQQTFMSAINKPQAAGTKVFQRFLPDPPSAQFADPLEAVDYLVLGATDPSMSPTPPELLALYMAARAFKGV
jgi:hypothetical protein